MRAKPLFLAAVLVVGWLASAVQAQQQAVRWQQTLQTAKQLAAQSNRLVLIHFWGASCPACLKMEQEVFSRADVAVAVEANYVAVKLNADYFPSTAREYGVTALPTDLIISSEGQLVERLVGFRPPADYIAGINWIASRAKGRGSPVYAQIPGTGPQAAPEPGATAANTSPPERGGHDGRFASPADAGPKGPDYSNRQPYGASGGGAGSLSTNSGLTTAPNWPPYTGPSQPSPTGQPYFSGGQPNYAGPGTPNGPPGSASQGMPAWRQGGIAIPPTSPGMAQNPIQPGPSPSAQSGAQFQPDSAAQAGSPPLPAGMPPLGLDGFCPVSLHEKARWMPGDRRWGAFHEGRTYLFAGSEEQERFLKNPIPYAPVMGGNDVVVMVDQRQMVPGQRRFGAWYDDRVYLFSSEGAYQKFYNDPPRYANAVAQSMRAAAGTSYR